MITYKKACAIAEEIRQKNFPDLRFVEVTDIEDRWAFLFTVDKDTVMTPAPSFYVHKSDGSVEWFSIPPLDNLLLLRSGARIPFLR